MLKTDNLENGKEQFKTYHSTFSGKKIQYDYRAENGALFSCVVDSVAEARELKTDWCLRNYYQ